jgi:2-amino-4-hydroxy-6-hydroxymethyldihydropteridine diphosphokinase
MSRAVLSLGSNMGDRLGYLSGAVELLRPWIEGVSPVFQTPPWGPVAQADYLNAVAIASDPAAQPAEWLVRAHRCEAAAGRVRDARWGPRTLDVDVICVDDVIIDDPDLTLPHPRAAERAFVLVPWWALDPEAALPGAGTVLELLNRLPAAEVAKVTMLAGAKLPA